MRDDLPPLTWRDATDDDYPEFARFQRVLGVDDMPIASRERWLGHLKGHSRWLVTPDGAVVGYVLCKPEGARGDVRQVAVDPAWHGRGLGRVVMAEARARLVAAGCTRWSLEVLAGNAPALALYARVGLRETGRSWTVRVAGAALAAACAGATPADDSDARDDAALDAQFDISPGLASRRAVWPASRVFAVRRAGGVIGVCRINAEQGPGLALVWPCRAADADVARRLLVHAPRSGEVEIYVQDAWLPEWLASLGGRVTHELITMDGPLA